MLILHVRRTFDRAGCVDVRNNRIGLLMRVSEFEERGGDGVVHDLDHAATDQFLVLDERQVGLDAGRVAIHHEADRSCRSQDCYLGVSIAVFFTVGQGFVPALLGGFY